ncbi:DHX36-like protein [Mya arenaria]|uniref:DHX36-like protein n=1 Tax=Mya arenaria TaxID=6604 RepID=A0ABY7F206_MYAAR|nr:DHX36-like protein [Mya arenaria]
MRLPIPSLTGLFITKRVISENAYIVHGLRFSHILGMSAGGWGSGSDWKDRRGEDRWHGNSGRRGRKGYHGNRGIHRGKRGNWDGQEREGADNAQSDGASYQGEWDTPSRGRGRGRGSSGHGGRPPGLRGKDIGMFYAQKSRAKKEQMIKEQRAEVTLEGDQRRSITRLLDDIRSSQIVSEAFDRKQWQNSSISEDFAKKQQTRAYQDMQKFREKLPAFANRQAIVDMISQNQVVVLSGETGCGKTTQVAERVASERGEGCGDSAGYMIRLEHKLPRDHGSILFCTTGILLKMLEGDKLLSRATHIILDEIHERDLLSDFLIIVLKDILAKRPDLKLVLMSATLNADAFSKYYDNCPMINIPGFTYPVEECLLEDVIEMLHYQVPKTMIARQPKRRDFKAQQEREDIGDGAILAFVPGWGEINEVYKKLKADSVFNPSSNVIAKVAYHYVITTSQPTLSLIASYVIVPLHSLMPTVNQREVFSRPPPGVRKIIIATNIAETSITIDDVVYVIDGGRIKVKGFSPETNMSSLDSELNALDKDENLLPLGKHLSRMPLDPHTGKMILYGAMFKCLDPILTIAASLSFKDPFYAPLEKKAEADKARMGLAENCLSDHITLVKAFDGWDRARQRGTHRKFCFDNFLSESTLMMLKKMREQLADVLYELGFLESKLPKQAEANMHSKNNALVKAIVCAGLYPNIGRIDKIPKNKWSQIKFRLKEGQCKLFPGSVAKAVSDPRACWVVYHKIMKTSDVWMYDCSLVSPYSLLFFGGDIKCSMEGGQNLELRQELDNILEERFSRGSRKVSHGQKSKEEAVMQAISSLVTSEDKIEKGGDYLRDDRHSGNRGHLGDKSDRRNSVGGASGRDDSYFARGKRERDHRYFYDDEDD